MKKIKLLFWYKIYLDLLDLSILRHFETFMLCSFNVLAKTCPPEPSATKYKKSVSKGFKAASIAILPGLPIAVGGT